VIDLAIITASLAHDRVAGSIASLTGVAETEAGLASGLNNASFQIGGAVGVAILSTVAVSGAHGTSPLAALTYGRPSAFAWRSRSRRSGRWRPACCSAPGANPTSSPRRPSPEQPGQLPRGTNRNDG
jgi:hypothetical protein